MKSVIIRARGNGYPSAGAYVPGNDGSLYRVVHASSSIHIDDSRARGNYIHATVELAEWSDCSESEQFAAIVEVAQ